MPFLLFKSAAGIPTRGLFARYNLDEGSGQTINDSSDQSNNGHLGSTSGVDTNDPTWTTSGGETVLSFDGIDDAIQGFGSVSDFGNNPGLTIICAASSTSVGEVSFSVKGANHVMDFGRFGAVGQAGMWVDTDTGPFLQGAISTTLVNDGSWHTIAGLYDGANIRVFIDGIEEGTPVAQTGLTNPSTNSFNISYPFAARKMDGLMGYYLAYGRGLSDAEVLATHNAIKALKPGLGLV